MPDASQAGSAERVFQKIRKEIVLGHFRPGERINIVGRAIEFGISTTPMREALNRLVGRDLAHERRGEGFYLDHLTTDEVACLYELHGCCIDIILTTAARPPSPTAADSLQGVWPIFANLAAVCANRVLSDLQRYLDDRLTSIRHAEGTRISGIGHVADRLHDALSRENWEGAREISKDFHDKCVENAGPIAQSMMRHARD